MKDTRELLEWAFSRGLITPAAYGEIVGHLNIDESEEAFVAAVRDSSVIESVNDVNGATPEAHEDFIRIPRAQAISWVAEAVWGSNAYRGYAQRDAWNIVEKLVAHERRIASGDSDDRP